MRVGLDVRMIENSGIGTTIRELLDHWDETQKKHLTLFGSFDWTESCPSVRVKVSLPIYSLKQHWAYPRILNSHPLTFFHMAGLQETLCFDRSRPHSCSFSSIFHQAFFSDLFPGFVEARGQKCETNYCCFRKHKKGFFDPFP